MADRRARPPPATAWAPIRGTASTIAGIVGTRRKADIEPTAPWPIGQSCAYRPTYERARAPRAEPAVLPPGSRQSQPPGGPAACFESSSSPVRLHRPRSHCSGGPGRAADDAPVGGDLHDRRIRRTWPTLNIYAAKQDVYLNGGPGINAPHDAAGLPAGTYSFQVTDPSGKTLLSTDAVACRQFTVDASGVIQSVAPSGGMRPCRPAPRRGRGHHRPALPVPRHAEQRRRVQGVGVADRAARLHGSRQQELLRASRASSKTRKLQDAFEARSLSRSTPASPVTARASTSTGLPPPGPHRAATSSTRNRALESWAFDEAHVEAAEQGNDKIMVTVQPGCTIDDVHAAGRTYRPVNGSVTVPVSAKYHAGTRRTSSTSTAPAEPSADDADVRRRPRPCLAARWDPERNPGQRHAAPS